MKKNLMKKIGAMMLVVGMTTATTASAMTVSPYARRSVGGITLRVVAWFNSGYKTTSDDAQYGVQAGKYIKQCWVRIKEGSYDKTEYSAAYTRAEAKQGQAELSKTNNPLSDATCTWGWKYN